MARKEEIQKEEKIFHASSDDYTIYKKGFKVGAEWADETMIGKFQDFLMEHFYEHPHESNFICTESFKDMEDMMEKLKKYMEE